MDLPAALRRLPASFTAPLSFPLDLARRARIDDVFRVNSGAVDDGLRALERCLRDPSDDSAAAEVDRTARSLLTALRAPSPADPEGLPAARLDAWVRKGAGVEIMDLPRVPHAVHRREIDLLDKVNVHNRHYEHWLAEILRIAEDAPSLRLVDLASGAGGFFRWIAANRPSRPALSLTATDLNPQYVEHGRTLATRAGLEVAFEVRNAFRLEDLAGQVDLFVCTQATHHMPPGFVVRLLASAVRAAPHGLLLVDVFRGGMIAFGSLLLTQSIAPDPLLAFDAFQSIRRGYTPAEFLLFARLAGVRACDARFEPPGHCIVHAVGARS